MVEFSNVQHTASFDLGTGISTTFYACWCNKCKARLWVGNEPNVPRQVYEHRCPVNGSSATGDR